MSSSSYSLRLQDLVGEMFIEIVQEKFPSTAQLLQAKMQIISEYPLSNASPSDFQSLISSCDSDSLLRLAEMDAKLVDVIWRVRKLAGILVLNAITDSAEVRSGDRFHEVLSRFQKANLPVSEVQRLVDFTCVWPSLTTHPTNPTGLAYTEVGLQLDSILASNSKSQTTRNDILKVLRLIRDTPMDEDPNSQGERKKTALKEQKELLLILNVLYNSVVGPLRALRGALDSNGYKEITLPPQLLRPVVWGAGDGDGNPNMTAESLRSLFEGLHEQILQNYRNDAKQMELEEIQRNLEQGQYEDPEQLIADLRKNGCSQSIEDFILKVQTFGFHFAKVDIRHNSVDLMITMGVLLEVCSDQKLSTFLRMDPFKQADVLRALFGNESFLEKARSLSVSCSEFTSQIPGENGEIAARVFTRLRLAARYPRFTEKLIIAETRSAANALAALLLLWASGNTVATHGTSINVVPLFESRQDLEEAPKIVHNLLTEPTFRHHVERCGIMLVMIAKSDTARLSGAGVQGAQERAVSSLLSMNTLSYGSFELSVMLGGGDDQMRGGGRIVESPHVVMRTAAIFGGTTPSRIAMTIQGLQMQLVFGSNVLCEHFQEAFCAQLLLANARVTHLLPWRPVPQNTNVAASLHQSRLFFCQAMKNYEHLIGSPDSPQRKTIIDYMSCFPNEFITISNKSSRPGARIKTADPLQGRAISLDQQSKHEGAYLTSTLGVSEALQEMNSLERYGGPENASGLPLSPIRHAYLSNKSFRDFIRLQATVLFQKDYEGAWIYRGGLPTQAERSKLEKEYKPDSYNPPRVFLAYLEKCDFLEARMLLEAITGHFAPPTQVVPLTEPMMAGWPDLALQMLYRRRISGLCLLLERKATERIKTLKSNGTVLDNWTRQLAYYAYVGANPTFSSPSFSLTMTDPQKEGLKKMSEFTPEVQRILRMPSWVQNQSKL